MVIENTMKKDVTNIKSRILFILSHVIFLTATLAFAATPIQSDTIPVADVVHESVVEESVDIPLETVIEEPEELEESVVSEPNDICEELPLSDEEIDLIALVTMAEAEGESELGKRLVIDVILNRVDSSRFKDTVSGVIYSKNAFECMSNGRVDRCRVKDDIRELVIEELQSRTNSNIHYFRTKHYHNFGKPVLKEGNHYFSTY